MTHVVGTGGGAGESGLPAIVLGPPRGGGAFQGGTDTVSLGLGGTITLAFDDNLIVDQPGPDLPVFENASSAVYLVRFVVLLGMVAAAAASRLLPHPPLDGHV